MSSTKPKNAGKTSVLSIKFSFLDNNRNSKTLTGNRRLSEAHLILKEIRSKLAPEAREVFDARIQKTLQTARSMRQKPKNGLLPKFIYVHFLNPKRLKAQATELLDDIRMSQSEIGLEAISLDMRRSHSAGGRGGKANEQLAPGDVSHPSATPQAPNTTAHNISAAPSAAPSNGVNDFSFIRTSSFFENDDSIRSNGTATPTPSEYGDLVIPMVLQGDVEEQGPTASALDQAADAANEDVEIGIIYTEDAPRKQQLGTSR